jgi:heme-degrading monooxygenase HmoA
MFMRLLKVEVDPEGLHLLQNLYSERVLGALEGVPGCRFAGLMQSIHHPDTCLSLTLWNTPEDAAAYERSGLFAQLLEESRLFFSESLEYSIKLSEDLQVEYVPVRSGPVVKSFPIAEQSETEQTGEDARRAVWLRIVSLKILPGKKDEFKKLYREHSIPALRSAPGCRYVYLLESGEDLDEVFSVTIWDSREHAAEYEASGVFERLLMLQKDTLSDLAQWKARLGVKEEQKAMSTDDVLVEHYTVLTGKSFT